MLAAALARTACRVYILPMSKSVNANIIAPDDRAARALQDRADHVAERLALVANAKRLLILCELAKGERSVGMLQQAVGLGQSALSQHLAKLREAGMVDTRRQGQTIFYRITDSDLTLLMTTLYDVFCKDV